MPKKTFFPYFSCSAMLNPDINSFMTTAYESVSYASVKMKNCINETV